MSGRPKSELTPLKRYKRFMTAGRYDERIRKLCEKKQKLEMMESIILMQELNPKHNKTYVCDLKRRANEVRSQLAVLSTVESCERP